MQPRFKTAACLAAALASSACSTRPRQFSAGVRPAGSTSVQVRDETATFATCNQLVRTGHRKDFAAAAASGAAAGLGLLGGAAAVAASGTVGLTTSTAGAVLSAAVPFVGLAVGLGVNRMIRSGKERKYKRVMTDCMGEFGYEVIDWTKAPKKQQGTAIRREAPINPAVTPAAEPAAPEVTSTG